MTCLFQSLVACVTGDVSILLDTKIAIPQEPFLLSPSAALKTTSTGIPVIRTTNSSHRSLYPGSNCFTYTVMLGETFLSGCVYRTDSFEKR